MATSEEELAKLRENARAGREVANERALRPCLADYGHPATRCWQYLMMPKGATPNDVNQVVRLQIGSHCSNCYEAWQAERFALEREAAYARALPLCQHIPPECYPKGK